MSDQSSLSSSLASSPCGSSTSVSPIERYMVTPEECYQSATEMPFEIRNGRKIFGPPKNFVGSRPPFMCEIHMRNLPRNFDDLQLLALLFRCGPVYEFRLMMESNENKHSYAFVRYTTDRDALAAAEFLNFLFFCKNRLRGYPSQDKNRLFINNISQEIPLVMLKEGFERVFPEILDLAVYPGKGQNSAEKPGYAFIEFSDHDAALEAMKRTTFGNLRMWGCDLKVDWARERLHNNIFYMNNKTNARSWRIQSPDWSPNDNCAKLRLFCLANNWCIPIVVYGRYLRCYGIQYGGILLKMPNSNEVCCLTMELYVERNVSDVHELMCDVAAQLLTRVKCFPEEFYAFRVLEGRRAEIVYSCYGGANVPENKTKLFVCPTAINELNAALNVLGQHTSESVLDAYKRSFVDGAQAKNLVTFIGRQSMAHFYSIYPKFRNNRPLNNGFNDTEITFLQALCNDDADCSITLRQPRNTSDFLILKSQRNNNNYRLCYVTIEDIQTQRVNIPPIWYVGHTYQKSIYKLNN